MLPHVQSLCHIIHNANAPVRFQGEPQLLSCPLARIFGNFLLLLSNSIGLDWPIHCWMFEFVYSINVPSSRRENWKIWPSSFKKFWYVIRCLCWSRILELLYIKQSNSVIFSCWTIRCNLNVFKASLTASPIKMAPRSTECSVNKRTFP